MILLLLPFIIFLPRLIDYIYSIPPQDLYDFESISLKQLELCLIILVLYHLRHTSNQFTLPRTGPILKHNPVPELQKYPKLSFAIITHPQSHHIPLTSREMTPEHLPKISIFQLLHHGPFTLSRKRTHKIYRFTLKQFIASPRCSKPTRS